MLKNCRLHPNAARSRGVRQSRWALVMGDYIKIREAALDSRRTLSQW